MGWFRWGSSTGLKRDTLDRQGSGRRSNGKECYGQKDQAQEGDVERGESKHCVRSRRDEGDESAALFTKNNFDDGPAVKSTPLEREVSIQRTF